MSSRFDYFPFNRESYLHHLWDFPTHRRIYDQNFGVDLKEQQRESSSESLPFDSLFRRRHRYYYPRPHLSSDPGSSSSPSAEPSTGMSENSSTADHFRIALDVAQFAPDEITVKTVDNYVIVHAKHEERPDEHGFVSREFTRRYLLPDGIDPVTITSALSRDGVLSVEAPAPKPESPKPNERIIPIVKLDEKDANDPSQN